MYIAGTNGSATVDNIRMYPTGLQGPTGPLVTVSNFVGLRLYHFTCQESFEYDNKTAGFVFGTSIVPVGGIASVGRGDQVLMRTLDNTVVQTRFQNPSNSNYWYVIKTVGGTGFGVSLTRFIDAPDNTEIGSNMLTTIPPSGYTKSTGYVTLVSPPSPATCALAGLAPSGATATTAWANKPIIFASSAGTITAGTIYYLVQANVSNNTSRFSISTSPGGPVV
jgi:hypothetical protein